MAPQPEHGPGSVSSFVWAQFAHSQATGGGAKTLSVGIVVWEKRGDLLVVFVRG